MKFHGIQIEEGSKITNLTIASGTAFPSSPDEGELFFRNDAAVNLKGLYCYIGGSWDRIASTESLTAPTGTTFPSTANEGDLFYLATNDGQEGLYAYNGSAWVSTAGAGGAASFTVTGDVTGTIDGGTDTLTLTTTGVTAGTYGSAGAVGSFSVDAKGRVTAAGNTSIQIAETQITDGTLLARLAANETVSGSWVFSKPVVSTTAPAASNAEYLRLQPSDYGTDKPYLYIKTTGASSTWAIGLWDGTDNGGTLSLSAGVLALNAASNIYLNSPVSSTSTITAGTGFVGSGAGLTNIPNGALTNSTITVGSTSIALGASASTLSGLTSVSSTTFTGALTGNASTATALQTGRTISVSGDGTGTSAAFTGAANASIPLTLATVNSNVGSFGSASQVSTVTVNAKGLVTAAGQTAIAISAAQVTSGTFDAGRLSGTYAIDISGAAASATVLSTARTIGLSGVTGTAQSFNGSSNITIPVTAVPASLLTGTVADARIAASSVTQHQASLSIAETQIPDGAILARLAVNETISGSWSFTSNVTVPLVPTADNHAVSKQYVDNSITGLDMKQSVRVATTGNITLSGTQTIDGVAVVAGDRVLVKDQTNTANNGIWVVAAGAWTRATDADGSPTNEVSSGLYTFVEEGTVNANTGWSLVTDGTIVVGTTGLVFAQFTGLGQITAGAGLTKTGSTIDVVGTSGRIVVNADSIDLATAGTAGTYRSVTTDAYGRVTAGTNPTTLAGYGITDAQPLDADLTALAALSSTGMLARTAANTFSTRAIAVSGVGLSVSNADGVSGNPTVTSNATNANTASTIVARDASGNFSAGTITAALSGNATSATSAATLSTARLINGVSFNGSADITITANTPSALTFNNAGTGAASGATFNGSAAQTISYNTIGAPSTTGTNASGTWGISITGSAASASSAATLSTARTIGLSGVTATAQSFNGSANITIPVTAVPASLLTGTVADAQISGSYTGLGSLTMSGSLSVGSNIIMTNAASVIYGSTDTGSACFSGGNSATAGANVLCYGGTASPASTGYLRAGSTNVLQWASGVVTVTGTITASGDITAFSDARLKKNVKTLEGGLAAIERVRGVTFNMLGETDGSKKHIGFIAQELEPVLPELVQDNDNGHKSVAYANMVAVLVEAVKELSAKVKTLEQKLQDQQ